MNKSRTEVPFGRSGDYLTYQDKPEHTRDLGDLLVIKGHLRIFKALWDCVYTSSKEKTMIGLVFLFALRIN